MPVETNSEAEHPLPQTRLPLKVEEVLLAASMAGIAIITGVNVVARYATNISLAFTEEYSIFLMILVALVGSSYAFACGRHIKVDYFVGLLPFRMRAHAETVGVGLSLLMFAILLFQGASMTLDDYAFDTRTPGLSQPQWIYTAMLPLFSALVVARCAGRIIRIWRERTS